MSGSQATWPPYILTGKPYTRTKPQTNLHNSIIDILDKLHMCQTIKDTANEENTLDLVLAKMSHWWTTAKLLQA